MGHKVEGKSALNFLVNILMRKKEQDLFLEAVQHREGEVTIVAISFEQEVVI